MEDSESSSAEENMESTTDALEKKKAIIKCSKGHKLKYTSPKVLNSNGYNNSYDCDLCLNTFYSEGSYHCAKCKHDLCENCYDNRADGKCPNHHQLQSFISTETDHQCNGCLNTVDEGSTCHGCRICDYDLCSNCFSYKDDKATSKKKDGGFSNFGALGELLQMIDTHMVFMDKQEENVDDFISKSGSADLLRKAKTAALETEKELMQGIMNISEMNNFLNNIILVENLFNSIYTKDIKAKQESARDKYASNIAVYEQKTKPECDIASFVELMFAGTNLHISSFKKWLKKVVDECEEKDINIVESSGARGKNIERAFYKSFYVYAVHHGNNGYKQMTDVLRCSLVFDDFTALYQCFAIIEQLALQDETGGILRVKDRFHPVQVPFGYRDMLINVYSPGSKVVAEIQLHHQLFFNHKEISHDIYKKARLFEDNDDNMAYKYADGHIRKVIGDKKYKTKKNKNKHKNKNKSHPANENKKKGKSKSKGDLKEDPGDDADEDDEDEDDDEEDEEENEKKKEEEEEDDDEDEEDIFAEHECEMSAEALFEKWKLTKYSESFIAEEGYDDPKLWKDITIDELKNEYGFKSGHAKKFISYVQELEQQRSKFADIKKKRLKIKKQKAKEAKLAKKGQIEAEMVETEAPQKAKTELKKQTAPAQKKSKQPLAQPIPLKKNNSVSSATSHRSQSQPPQTQQPQSPRSQASYGQPQAKQSTPPQQPYVQSQQPPQQPQSYATPPQQPSAQPYVPPQQRMPPQQQPQQYVLPPGWTALRTNDGKIYYANTVTKQTQWNKPTHAATQPQYAAPTQPQGYMAPNQNAPYQMNPQQAQYGQPVPQQYAQAPPQYGQQMNYQQQPQPQPQPQQHLQQNPAAMQQQASSYSLPQPSSAQPRQQHIPSASLQQQNSGYNANQMRSPRQPYGQSSQQQPQQQPPQQPPQQQPPQQQQQYVAQTLSQNGSLTSLPQGNNQYNLSKTSSQPLSQNSQQPPQQQQQQQQQPPPQQQQPPQQQYVSQTLSQNGSLTTLPQGNSQYNQSQQQPPPQQQPPQQQQQYAAQTLSQNGSLPQGNSQYNISKQSSLHAHPNPSMQQQNSQYSLQQQPQSQPSAQPLPQQNTSYNNTQQPQYVQQQNPPQQNNSYIQQNPPQQSGTYIQSQNAYNMVPQQVIQQPPPQQMAMIQQQQQVMHSQQQPYSDRKRDSGALGGVMPGDIHLQAPHVVDGDEIGNDTDQFCEELAEEIADDDDNNFDSAFNSLYGKEQNQQASM